MSKNIYKTAQGQDVDMDRLRLLNEDTIAVGNMNVNARGDRVASDGSVITPRGQVMKEHYRLNTPWIKKSNAVAPKRTLASAPAPVVATSAAEPVIASAPSQVINTVVEPVAPTVTEEVLTTENQLRGSLASAILSVEVGTPETSVEIVDSTNTTTNTFSRI